MQKLSHEEFKKSVIAELNRLTEIIIDNRKNFATKAGFEFYSYQISLNTLTILVAAFGITENTTDPLFKDETK